MECQDGSSHPSLPCLTLSICLLGSATSTVHHPTYLGQMKNTCSLCFFLSSLSIWGNDLDQHHSLQHFSSWRRETGFLIDLERVNQIIYLVQAQLLSHSKAPSFLRTLIFTQKAHWNSPLTCIKHNSVPKTMVDCGKFFKTNYWNNHNRTDYHTDLVSFLHQAYRHIFTWMTQIINAEFCYVLFHLASSGTCRQCLGLSLTIFLTIDRQDWILGITEHPYSFIYSFTHLLIQ